MKKTKLFSLLTAAFLLAGSLTGCAGDPVQTTSPAENVSPEAAPPAPTENGEAEPADSGTGVIETLYHPDFTIERLSDGIKRVTDGEGRELILVPKSLGRIPAEYSDSLVITTPVENAVFLSTTQVCTFRTVNDPEILDKIGAVEGGADSWSALPEIKERVADGRIADITGAGYGDPDYEKLQALEPDVVFVYTGDFGQQSVIAKLEELGIPYAVDNDYLESDYLSRMEWIRFVLTFYNADDRADEAMKNAAGRIAEAKERIAGLEKPTVAVFSVYNGAVSAASDDSWFGTLIADMGGVNAFSGANFSAITMEYAFDAAHDADVILYTASAAFCDGIAGISDAFPQITECGAYKNGRLYQYTDLFWYGVDESDRMACDFAAILYPEAFGDRELKYYTKVEK